MELPGSSSCIGSHGRHQVLCEEEKESRFSVAPVWNLDEHWKLAVDLGASRVRSTSQTVRSRFGELGAIYSPNADLDFALGFIHQKDKDTDDVAKTATAGVTWKSPRAWAMTPRRLR